MKNKTTWIVSAVLVNALLLPFAFGSPAEASAVSPKSGLYDCCRGSTGGGEYCCNRCCWLPWACGDLTECGDA